jgi:hypothetical protein
MSDSAPIVTESPEVAAARAEYERLAEECRLFDPHTITLMRQWNQEVAGRHAQRRKQRQELIDRKGFAFNAWKAAEAGQADLAAELQKKLAEKTAAQEAAYHAFQEAEAEIVQIRARLNGAPQPTAVAEVPPPVVPSAEPPAETPPANTEDESAGDTEDDAGDDSASETGDDDATEESTDDVPPAEDTKPAAKSKPGKKKR